MSSAAPSKRSSGVLSSLASSQQSHDSRRGSGSGGAVAAAAVSRLRGAPSASQRSAAASHSAASTAAVTPSAHRGLQGSGAESLLDIDGPPQEVSGRAAGGPGSPNPSTSAAAAAAEAGSAVLTVGALEAASAPDAYTGSASRHVKDEIDELLYQLSVKEKEVRISRGSVQTELAAIKRSMAKMQRDADDLMRQQNTNIATMGKAR